MESERASTLYRKRGLATTIIRFWPLYKGLQSGQNRPVEDLPVSSHSNCLSVLSLHIRTVSLGAPAMNHAVMATRLFSNFIRMQLWIR